MPVWPTNGGIYSLQNINVGPLRNQDTMILQADRSTQLILLYYEVDRGLNSSLQRGYSLQTSMILLC